MYKKYYKLQNLTEQNQKKEEKKFPPAPNLPLPSPDK